MGLTGQRSSERHIYGRMCQADERSVLAHERIWCAGWPAPAATVILQLTSITIGPRNNTIDRIRIFEGQMSFRCPSRECQLESGFHRLPVRPFVPMQQAGETRADGGGQILRGL